jgi:hypothetical protein
VTLLTDEELRDLGVANLAEALDVHGIERLRLPIRDGGVPTSHHALGLAVDFRVAGMTCLEAARVLAASDLQFDQLIWYRPSGVLHLSFHPQMRRQVRTNPTTAAGARLLVGLVP